MLTQDEYQDLHENFNKAYDLYDLALLNYLAGLTTKGAVWTAELNMLSAKMALDMIMEDAGCPDTFGK